MDSMDKQLEEALQRAETPIADDGFSETVLSRLPKRSISKAQSRRWTLAAAAAIGSFLTLLLAPPIDTALGSYEISSVYERMILEALMLSAILVVPVVWLLHSQLTRDLQMPAIGRPRALSGGKMLRF